MLSAIVNAFVQGVRRDLYFVPVSIHYGRIPEEEAYRREVAGEEKERESLGALLRARSVLLEARYGTAYVSFGDPISLARGARRRSASASSEGVGDPPVEEEKRRFVQRLGFRLLREVNAAAVAGATLGQRHGAPRRAARRRAGCDGLPGGVARAGRRCCACRACSSPRRSCATRRRTSARASPGSRAAGSSSAWSTATASCCTSRRRSGSTSTSTRTTPSTSSCCPSLLTRALLAGVPLERAARARRLVARPLPLGVPAARARDARAPSSARWLAYYRERGRAASATRPMPEHPLVRATAGILENFREAYLVAARTMAAQQEWPITQPALIAAHAAAVRDQPPARRGAQARGQLGRDLRQRAVASRRARPRRPCVRRGRGGRERWVERGPAFDRLPELIRQLRRVRPSGLQPAHDRPQADAAGLTVATTAPVRRRRRWHRTCVVVRCVRAVASCVLALPCVARPPAARAAVLVVAPATSRRSALPFSRFSRRRARRPRPRGVPRRLDGALFRAHRRGPRPRRRAPATSVPTGGRSPASARPRWPPAAASRSARSSSAAAAPCIVRRCGAAPDVVVDGERHRAPAASATSRASARTSAMRRRGAGRLHRAPRRRRAPGSCASIARRRAPRSARTGQRVARGRHVRTASGWSASSAPARVGFRGTRRRAAPTACSSGDGTIGSARSSVVGDASPAGGTFTARRRARRMNDSRRLGVPRHDLGPSGTRAASSASTPLRPRAVGAVVVREGDATLGRRDVASAAADVARAVDQRGGRGGLPRDARRTRPSAPAVLRRRRRRADPAPRRRRARSRRRSAGSSASAIPCSPTTAACVIPALRHRRRARALRRPRRRGLGAGAARRRRRTSTRAERFRFSRRRAPAAPPSEAVFLGSPRGHLRRATGGGVRTVAFARRSDAARRRVRGVRRAVGRRARADRLRRRASHGGRASAALFVASADAATRSSWRRRRRRACGGRFVDFFAGTHRPARARGRRLARGRSRSRRRSRARRRRARHLPPPRRPARAMVAARSGRRPAAARSTASARRRVLPRRQVAFVGAGRREATTSERALRAARRAAPRPLARAGAGSRPRLGGRFDALRPARTPTPRRSSSAPRSTRRGREGVFLAPTRSARVVLAGSGDASPGPAGRSGTLRRARRSPAERGGLPGALIGAPASRAASSARRRRSRPSADRRRRSRRWRWPARSRSRLGGDASARFGAADGNRARRGRGRPPSVARRQRAARRLLLDRARARDRSLTDCRGEPSRHLDFRDTRGMPDDHEQIVVRRRKLAALRERGSDPYPNDFRPDHTAAEVHARFGGARRARRSPARPPCAVAGRVMALRDFGKAAFLQLQDRAGAAPGPRPSRPCWATRPSRSTGSLDLGDVIGVAGRPFRTRTGELTHRGRRRSGSSPRRCARCPRSGTACRTSRRATASATST